MSRATDILKVPEMRTLLKLNVTLGEKELEVNAADLLVGIRETVHNISVVIEELTDASLRARVAQAEDAALRAQVTQVEAGVVEAGVVEAGDEVETEEGGKSGSEG